MSPEISTTNKVRYRVGVAEKAWREALELVREAAAVPGYSGARARGGRAGRRRHRPGPRPGSKLDAR